MQPARDSLLLGIGSLLLLLSACGSSSYSSSRGTISLTSGGTTGGNSQTGNPIGGGGGPTGANNSIIATPSVSGTVSVAVGAKQTISITFTSSDGSAISGFGISGAFGSLPAGWSGPTSFTCSSVSGGSGCVLNLSYAPVTAGKGTLTLDYVFVDNATMPSTGGSLTIGYAATAHNNVVAVSAPTGEINAIVGAGSQSVSVGFTTDDGKAAANFALTTDLTALPAGWSSSASSFTCAIVSEGSGCQLPLSYSPRGSARGTLTMNYRYSDDSGVIRTGALNIPYSTSTRNDVVATASPSGEINAVPKSGGRNVAVNFTTDDGKPATGVYVISDLSALPTGWSSASKNFSCASASTGNGCQLHLIYAPAALTSGTLILNYAYTDSAGLAKTGSFNIAYAATTDDDAAATASPTGQINAIAPAGTQPVSVTFTTDDGRTGTALQLKSDLSALPPGWNSAAASFSCNSFSSGNGCQLPLAYAPTGAGSGTLVLSYSYINNAGKPKSGSVDIAYRATTDDNIVWASKPVLPLAVSTGSTTTVDVTFSTDDGNLASGFSVTSGLGTLPIDWSSASDRFACSTVSIGTMCRLSLTYMPTAPGVGTLSLSYAYNDNAGAPKSGTVSIPYTAM